MNQRVAMRIVVLLTLLLQGIIGTGASAAPSGSSEGQGPGRVRITIEAPNGVPATVVLDGATNQVATKAPNGTSAVVVRDLPSGAYRVRMPRVVVDGQPYVGVATRPELVVRPDATTDLRVRYVAEPAAAGIHATDIGRDSVSLAWVAPPGARVAIRRMEGTSVARTRGKGVAVAVDGSTATDSGLRPGQRYTYAVFTQHRGRWLGPTALTLSTAPSQSRPNDATYVAAPTTLLALPSDVVATTVTADGASVTLADHVPTPVPGAAIVLPDTGGSDGGIGVVAAVSDDGRTVDLVQGGLGDAFDYYALSIADMSGPIQEQVAEVAEVTSTIADQTTAGTDQPILAAATTPCSGTGGQKVSFAPKVRPGGYLHLKLDKYKALGVSLPKGVSISTEIFVTVTGGVAVDTSVGVTCEYKLKEVELTIPSSPVNVEFSVQPGAKVSVEGKVKVSNVGFETKTGFRAEGHLTLDGLPSFTSSRIADRRLLDPKLDATGRVRLKLGLDIAVGPKVGIAGTGATAGIGGEINPFDAQFQSAFPAPDPRWNDCLKAEASFSMAPFIRIKASLGGHFKWTEKVTLDAVDKSWPYATLYYPKNCEDLPATGPEPDDSLLGPGVDKIEDSTTGGDGQWGHVDGFVPNKKTWVLSTGLVSDATGVPSQFASTDLGRDGDPELTQFAGYPTYDAATYTVKIVPNGDTLHVRYVFASEEYPEFVGSEFNDVMAVRVGGKNCAFVPGTTTAVSVNTINDQTNSAYYVDNADGATGYGTTMDGLTKPLTCSVPVTPGTPVTVDIRVADGSDHVYDSAVALLDGGIWTD